MGRSSAAVPLQRVKAVECVLMERHVTAPDVDARGS